MYTRYSKMGVPKIARCRVARAESGQVLGPQEGSTAHTFYSYSISAKLEQLFAS